MSKATPSTESPDNARDGWDLPFEPNAAEEPEEPPEPPEAVTRAAGVTPDEIDHLPRLPGVYIMRDRAGRAIYIGKAANLASRVKSYFTRAGDARFNVRYLMRHVERIETVITANETEALLLGNTLIKRHQPRYNLQLRDDKTYVSVRVNLAHPWPRAVVMRRRQPARKEEGVVYLGPYASAAGVRDTLRQLQRVFPIRSCPDAVLNNRGRPCLLHQIGRCCAPCTEPVDDTILVLRGRTRELLADLRRRMDTHSDAMEYEQAAVLRDRVRAIEETTERQRVHEHGGGDRDAVAMRREGGFVAFVVFVYRGGLLVSSRPYLARDHGRPDEALLEEFLTRYYDLEAPPREVLAALEPRGRETLESWLSGRREATVSIAVPQRGAKAAMVATAGDNARRLLDQHLSGEATLEAIQQELVAKLRLPEPPEVIECYDISTIQGRATVGSMVTFRHGEPDKGRYRRFRIRRQEGQDDFAAMREMLERRLRRVAGGEEPAPGLIVIDGGKGQLGVAVDVLERFGLRQVPVVAMAKSRLKRRGEQSERTEERFFLPGRVNPVVLRSNSPALYLLVRLRDEAHRFAITYHRSLRGRSTLKSGLEEIDGVGKKRAATLLRQFGSMRALREATAEVIGAVRGVSRPLAERIHAALHETDSEQT